MVTNRKVSPKTTFVLSVKIKNVRSAKPQTVRYIAITALNPGDAAPAAALVPVVEYGAARPSVGNWSTPKESQKTEKRPETIYRNRTDYSVLVIERRKNHQPPPGRRC